MGEWGIFNTFYNSVHSLMMATIEETKHVVVICKIIVVYLSDCLHFYIIRTQQGSLIFRMTKDKFKV